MQPGYDLIIAGDGPAGLAGACTGARGGLRVLVLSASIQRPTAGLLTPIAVERFTKLFGPLPDEAIYDNSLRVKGYALHFPSQISVRTDFTSGTGVYVQKALLARHMLKAALESGARVMEGAQAVSVSQSASGVDVTLADGSLLRAKAFIGAQGGGVPLYPERKSTELRATLFAHAIVDSALEEDRSHIWIGGSTGALCIAYLRAGRCGLVILRRPSEDITELHEQAVQYIKDRSGLWLQSSPERTDEAPLNLAPAAMGRFSMGKGNIAIAGEAAGFICPPIEGTSAALETGALAGEAAVLAAREGGSLAERYRTLAKAEILRVADQWQPVRLLFASPHEVDIKTAFRALRDDDQYAAGSDIIRHMRANGMGFGMGLVMRGVWRQLTGGY